MWPTQMLSGGCKVCVCVRRESLPAQDLKVARKLTGDIVIIRRDTQADVVGQDGHHVDDGHDTAHEFAPIRSGE